MNGLVSAILLLSFALFSCNGNIRADNCPDGEPVFITKKIEDAYPAYVQEYQAGLSVTEELFSKAQASATLKTKAVKLRQDLDQERAELETRHKTVIMALQTTPCDKTARDNAWRLLGDIKTKTTQIPSRVKQLNDDAAAKLESEVSNLLHYPDAAHDIVKPETALENMLVDKLPRRLFDLLVQYNDQAILSVPKIGTALRDHKVAYYTFRKVIKRIEDTTMRRIGEKVSVQFRAGWSIYYTYVLARYGGNTQPQIVAEGNILNYSITWDDCERMYQELLKDESLSQAILEIFRQYKAMGENVTKLAMEV